MKQIISSISLFLIIILSAAYGQNTNPNRTLLSSVVLILDSSYSMRMQTGTETGKHSGENRMQAAVKFLSPLLKGVKGPSEWALVTFGEDTGREDTGKGRDVVLRIPFSSSYGKILNYSKKIEPWGLSSIDSAVAFGINYCSTEGKGEKKAVILISDGISSNTDDFLPSWRSFLKILNDNSVSLYFAGFPLKDNNDLHTSIKDSSEKYSGGLSRLHFYTVTQPAAIAMEINRNREPLAAAGKNKNTADAADIRNTKYTGIKRINPFFLIITFLLLALIFSFLYFALFKKGKTEKIPVGTRTFARLKIIHPSGSKELRRIHKLPAVISSQGDADVLLPESGLKGKRRGTICKIEYFNNTPFIRSNIPLTINGVERKQKKLKEEDLILFGRYRIIFYGTGSENIYKTRRKKPFLACMLNIAGFFVLVLILLLFNIKPLTETVHPEKLKQTKTNTTKIKEKNIPPEKFRYGKVKIYNPADSIKYFKADMVFFHAHPDDESLDFGALMARASRAGKKIVTVLFTDGESGLDQYPARIVNSTYPPHDLKGKNLSAVRAGEAERAMSVLGSAVYIRLGLKNHPYNSVAQILPRQTVLKDWGGEKKLVKKITEIIRGFHPSVIVAPDLHTAAYEHFEHEAAGYIVREAVSRINSMDGKFIKGYIVSVDPLQREVYPGKIRINAMKIDQDLDVPYRIIQRAALKQHITQRDASVIGVEILPDFKYEYYFPEKWKLPVSLENYVKK
ncbi:MAG: VWA domain-containing protein [Spirochaetes bacterium]|nr:VWA domain-containing protein [Spirochaetota bacterium]